MATRDLDRWLLNKGPYPEGILNEGHYTDGYKPQAVNVRAMNTSGPTTKSVEAIVCPTCSGRATRQGAQDYCDVYLCDKGHVTRLEVGKGKREAW